MISCDRLGGEFLDGTVQTNAQNNALPKSARLNKQHEFTAVFRGNNRRVSDRYWTVLALPRDPLDGSSAETPRPAPARLGLAITKKRAKRAVDRNRLKRVVRESFRQHQALINCFDIIVMNRDSCVAAGSADLSRSLLRLWQKLFDAEHKGEKEKRNTGNRSRPQKREQGPKLASGNPSRNKPGAGGAQ